MSSVNMKLIYRIFYLMSLWHPTVLFPTLAPFLCLLLFTALFVLCVSPFRVPHPWVLHPLVPGPRTTMQAFLRRDLISRSSCRFHSEEVRPRISLSCLLKSHDTDGINNESLVLKFPENVLTFGREKSSDSTIRSSSIVPKVLYLVWRHSTHKSLKSLTYWDFHCCLLFYVVAKLQRGKCWKHPALTYSFSRNTLGSVFIFEGRILGQYDASMSLYLLCLMML